MVKDLVKIGKTILIDLETGSTIVNNYELDLNDFVEVIKNSELPSFEC